MIQQVLHQGKVPVGIYKELSADERTRMLAESRENARRDEASRMRGAERKKAKEIAREMMGDNMPVSQIIKYTGLSQDEIFQLSQ